LGLAQPTLPRPFPDVTPAYVHSPTPLPEVAAMTAADKCKPRVAPAHKPHLNTLCRLPPTVAVG